MAVTVQTLGDGQGRERGHFGNEGRKNSDMYTADVHIMAQNCTGQRQAASFVYSNKR